MLPVAHPARPRRRLLAAALLGVAALLSALFAMTDRSQAALPGATGFGVGTGGASQGEDAPPPGCAMQDEVSPPQGRCSDLIRDAGAHWIRIDINWAQVQRRGPSSYDWE